MIKGIFMFYQYVNVVTINKVAVIEFNYGRKLNALSPLPVPNYFVRPQRGIFLPVMFLIKHPANSM
ncbi:hypothetical protein BEC67_15395 [Escherichia coli]|nr:hypothetical protein [Escherichia coli]